MVVRDAPLEGLMHHLIVIMGYTVLVVDQQILEPGTVTIKVRERRMWSSVHSLAMGMLGDTWKNIKQCVS